MEAANDGVMRNKRILPIVLATLLGAFASQGAAAFDSESPRTDAPGNSRVDTSSTPCSDTLSSVRVEAAGRSDILSSAPLRQMNRARIDTLAQEHLAGALNSFAGVSVKDYGGRGGLKTVDVRNLGAAHTAVEYDGVDMGNMQNAQVDISRFELGELSVVRLEMTGSDDIFSSATRQLSANVLSLESARPLFGEGRSFHLSARLSAASFGTWDPRLCYEQRLDKDWSMRLGGSFLYSRGDYPFYVQNGNASEWQRRTGSEVRDGRGQWELFGQTASGQWMAKLMYDQGDRGLPGPVIFYVQEPTEHLWNKDLTALVRWENQYAERWRVRANISYSWSFTRYRNDAALLRVPEVDNYDNHKLALGAVVSCRLHPDWQLSLAEDIILAKLDSDMPESCFPRRLHSATALSGKFEHGIWLVRGTLGLIYVTDKVDEGAAAQSLPKRADRLHFSPSLSASCALVEGLHLRGSYKDSYRMPSFNDLYYARVGNPGLLPERAHQFNLGLTWGLGSKTPDGRKDAALSVELSADGYCNLIRDKIVAIPKMFIWSMRNVGEAVAAGTDLSLHASYAFSPDISIALQAKYSYQYAVDVTDAQSKTYRQQLPYTPRHTGAATLSLLTSWINVNYTLDGASERFSIGQELPAYRLDAYLLHSLSLSHTFPLRGWKLYVAARADNLADTQYEIIKSYPMPGFQWQGILRIIL